MQTASFAAPNCGVHLEDLGSEDFFELDFAEGSPSYDSEEIGAGFDFTSYEKTLRLKRRALQLLGIRA